MGFLDKKERILDVVLTDKGRDLLSRNQLSVKYYAFSDESIDYSGSQNYARTPNVYNDITHTLIQNVTTGSAGDGYVIFTASFAATPQDGNSLIAVIGNQGGAAVVTSVTQTGATWNKVMSASDTGGNGTHFNMWYAANISSAAKNVIFTLNGADQVIVQMAEYRGILTLDQTASNALDATYATGSTGITATTTVDYELWIAGMSSIAGTQHTASNGFSLVGSVTGSAILNASMWQKVVNAKAQAESIFSFTTAFNPLDFNTAPNAVPVGGIATFYAALSSSNRNTTYDDDVYKTLTFESSQRKITSTTGQVDFSSFLYTAPLGSKIGLKFDASKDDSQTITLERRYKVVPITEVKKIPENTEAVVRIDTKKELFQTMKSNYLFNQKIQSIFDFIKSKNG